jgi:hypothetical protein
MQLMEKDPPEKEKSPAGWAGEDDEWTRTEKLEREQGKVDQRKSRKAAQKEFRHAKGLEDEGTGVEETDHGEAARLEGKGAAGEQRDGPEAEADHATKTDREADGVAETTPVTPPEAGDADGDGETSHPTVVPSGGELDQETRSSPVRDPKVEAKDGMHQSTTAVERKDGYGLRKRGPDNTVLAPDTKDLRVFWRRGGRL